MKGMSMLGHRWSKTEFRTPIDKSFSQWKKSPEYKALKSQYDKKRYAEKKYPYREMREAYDSTIHGRARRLWISSRSRAKIKGIEHSLSVEWFVEKLTLGRCEMTGMNFVYVSGKGRKNPFSPSVDRKDISRGYSDENCQMVLWAVNVAIADFGVDVYLKVAKAMLEKHGGGVS